MINSLYQIEKILSPEQVNSLGTTDVELNSNIKVNLFFFKIDFAEIVFQRDRKFFY